MCTVSWHHVALSVVCNQDSRGFFLPTTEDAFMSAANKEVAKVMEPAGGTKRMNRRLYTHYSDETQADWQDTLVSMDTKWW